MTMTKYSIKKKKENNESNLANKKFFSIVQKTFYRKHFACCRLCTPMCAILTAFAAFLLAIVIAISLIAVLVKNKSSTTSMTSECSCSFPWMYSYC